MNYTFYQLLSTDSIGDNLSSVNINYENLDEWTTSIQFSATNYWQPLVNFYENIISKWNTNVSYLTNNKLNWDKMVSTVQVNSSKWLTPLVLMYPNVLSSSNISEITNWININSPCISSNTIYIENQKAYVYALSSTTITSDLKVYSSNSGLCKTTPTVKICATCKTNFSGTAQCSNGDVVCDGGFTTCNECSNVSCKYPQSNASTYTPSIEAYLTINYKDISEAQNILCLNYVVSACEWVFVKSINSTISQQ